MFSNYITNPAQDEVLAALGYKGIYNLSDLEFAVLEIDGSISVLEKSQCRLYVDLKNHADQRSSTGALTLEIS